MNLGLYSIEIKRPTIEEFFASLAGYGFSEVQFDFLSVCNEEMPEVIDPILIKRIKETAQQNHIKIVAVNGTFNMSHPDSNERSKGIERFKNLARACRGLGCEFVTLCTGSRDPQNMWRRHADNHSSDAWLDLMNTTEKVIAVAEQEDLVLGLEVEASNIISSAMRARKYIVECKSKHLKVIMDAANLFQPGEAKKENVHRIMDEAFDLLGPDIYLAHGKDIKEGDRLDFTHAGNGIIDFPYYLKRLHEAGYKGGILLHGIKDEKYVNGCVTFMKQVMHSSAANESSYL